jgi:hypothetical protein
MIVSILGLIFVFIAGCILLPKIFITDKELSFLEKLPIEPSTSHMTGAESRANLPVAVTDVDKIKEYRDRYIKARKEERAKGRIGLWFLAFGALLQIGGVILTGLGL